MSSTTTPPATSSTAGTTTTIEIVSPLAPPTGEVIATGDGWEMAQLGEPFRFLVPLAVHDYIEDLGLYAEPGGGDMVGDRPDFSPRNVP